LEGMRIATLYHTEMVRELVVLRATVSSTVEFVLRRSPNKTLRVEIVDEMIAEFCRQEEWRSRF
jgi:hypothetical protein